MDEDLAFAGNKRAYLVLILSGASDDVTISASVGLSSDGNANTGTDAASALNYLARVFVLFCPAGMAKYSLYGRQVIFPGVTKG